ncbi:2-oxoacid:acceptor oxidoreductase family protein [Desulfatiglans anilini]|uniref:2-oxoacid:acceptor oxidoreductase family protein n=1 Tax=Desulfatiglans anilini TaxID=90728 RepID=UPI0003FDDA77|nr:2-oxoacid:acceptor oxidoreductase family protein [Desulfatiglans anilini]
MERCRLVFSGSGGQGVITAAIILAEAAVLHEGLVATQSQSYGPEARGGATRSDVIISDSPIRFPKANQPNVLVCLTQEAYNKFFGIIRPGGILLTDPRYVKPEGRVDARLFQLPLYREVMDRIGKPIVYNICMLGAVVELTGVVQPGSVQKVLQNRIPPGVLDINLEAFALGCGIAAPFAAR